ncbi:MAG: bifunctional serine/threonine-protein kinase/formylglycine-generating enzyme family protein [Lysobacterales bacterium]
MSPDPAVTASDPLPPGTLVDTLRIDRVLGAGAFGVTYLVTDTLLGTSFALKEYLPRDLAGRAPDALQHFLAEGRTLARLAHGNIVKVLRCFEANGTAYLLMPYYRGEALHKLLARSGTFTEEEALALARPLLDALEYLHDQGVIHQDIKPANIYITEDGTPILLDFGAAAQGRLGSEGYAAAEQSAAQGEMGPWTDIYGLAATLYRCIGGVIPVAATRRQAARQAREADPLEPLSRLVPRKNFARIIPAIETGLAIEPGARPQSVAAWWPAFAAGPKHDPGRDPKHGPEEGREWLPLILLGLFILLLGGAVAYLLLDAGPEAPVGEAPSRQSGVSPEEAARWQAALDADTAFAYRLFMGDHPDSIHSDQARLHLQRLDGRAWEQARADGSRAAIETYLEQFPAGLHEADAKIALEELRLAEERAAQALLEQERQDHTAWAAAAAQRSEAAVDAYLSAWPAGLHADEARALRGQLASQLNDRRAFDAARKLNTVAGYQAYVDAFPRGASVAAALEAIDDLTLRPGKTFRDCADCPTMMVLPSGSFWQGSEESATGALRNETPRRMVTIAEPFAIGVFETTFEQWDRCVAAGACSTRPPDNDWGRGSRPVIMVSWSDAAEYVAWLSSKTGQAYALPSESQWEYAARAGEEEDWIGGDAEQLCAFANVAGSESGLRWQHAECADPAALETLPVGSLQPNAFGLYDVIGNVAEWTLDCMNLSYLDAPADGSAWSRGICSSRMTRGGSWFTGSKDIRLPARFNLKNGDRNDFTGFRVVRKVAM